MDTLAELTVASIAAILVVAAARRPLRRIAGARIAYWLWLLVPASLAAVSIPSPPGTWQMAATLQGSVARAFPAAAALGHPIAADDHMGFGLELLIIWGSGVLVMLAVTVRRHRAFVRSLGNTAVAADGTHRSSTLAGPALVGVWRPRVFLPADFESLYGPEERACVLAHEHAHRRRGDPLANAIAAAGVCCFWFNPLVHWAAGRVRFDQELACDETVLLELGMRRRRYAGALLKTQLAADSGGFLPTGCHWQSVHPLKERIKMLNRSQPTAARRVSGALLTFALIVSGGAAIWAAQPRLAVAQAEPPQASSGAGELRQMIVREGGTSVVADRVIRSPDGGLELSGHVLVKRDGASQAGVSAEADKVDVEARADRFTTDGSRAVLEGEVRISVEGSWVLTTNRAVFDKDGTVRMDSAHFSPSA
jgi:bla regulator protein BlaR1